MGASDVRDVANNGLGMDTTWKDFLRRVGLAKLLDQISAPAICLILCHCCGHVTLRFADTKRYGMAYLPANIVLLKMVCNFKMVVLDD